MGFQESYMAVLNRLPSVVRPVQRMTFNAKIKWTGLVLILYFILAQIPAYGIDPTGYEQFKFLEVLLGSSFGTIMSLGIGPIVTASIILQLLVGSKLIPWDLQTQEGKALFQGTQKLLGILFAVVEAGAYVIFGAIPAASPNLTWIVIGQLALGGVMVIFMDELISKWGFGSGISLFIVAGVSKTMLVRSLNPLSQAGTLPTAANPPAGIIPLMVTLIGSGEIVNAFFSFLPVVATILVFFLVVYASAIKVEIPLAFGSIRGFSRRWPLKFFYTSNIPVILTAALLANVSLLSRTFAAAGNTFLGTYDSQGNPTGGLAYFLTAPNNAGIQSLMITISVFILLAVVVAYFTKRNGLLLIPIFTAAGGLAWYGGISSLGLTGLVSIPALDVARMLTYLGFLVGGSVLFSVFWVTTAGMDAKAVAGQIQGIGMQIPGYRRDPRIIEGVLNRYIPALTILGGASVGALAAFADFTGALGTGTGILLTTMIVIQLYEELATKHVEDMHPAFRKFFGKQ
jgi:preprotein translocase subunit SecY